MKRIFAAGLLALPALLAGGSAGFAQGPGCSGPGCAGGAIGAGYAGGFGADCYGQAGAIKGCCQHMGCGCFCMRFLGAIHFNGPLWNYGPYTGYYPFEPYGPWNAALQYTGPYPQNGCCGWGGLFGHCGAGGCGPGGSGAGGWGHGGHAGHLGHHGGKDGCSECGDWSGYARTTWLNVHHRVHPLGHKAKCGGCDGCSSINWATDAPVVAASERQSDIQQTSYPRSER
jgi:hypothetical protein